MQLAYQFPEMVERLVLVSSGGLGPEVSLVLRAAALPGADPFIYAHGRRSASGSAGRSAAASPRSACAPAPTSPRSCAATPRSTDPDRRAAFLATLRSVIGTGGQRVDATDRLYLAEACAGADRLGRPRLDHPGAAWRGRPPAIPGSRLEIFEDVGHLPQLEAPGRFIAVLERFLRETEPAQFDREEWMEHFRAAA